MDIFATIKDILKPVQVARYYLGEPKKKNNNTLFYYSPLRVKERTPSLAVNNNKGFTDFGTGKNYDIFSFISELYNCNIRQSCDILIRDFGLNINIENNKNNLELLKKQRDEQLKVQEAINNWNDEMYEVLTNLYKHYRNLKYTLPVGSKSLPFIYQKEQYYESLVDIFYNANINQKLALYKDKERFDIYERERRVF